MRVLIVDDEPLARTALEQAFRGRNDIQTESLSLMAEKLKPHGFIRIHRSVLVNTSFVEEIQPWPTGEYILKIKGGQELTVTRMYKNNLKSIAQRWVGTDPFS